MALSVLWVYFRIMHRLGRSHYVWDEYLYSVGLLEKVEIKGDCKCNCLCSVIVLYEIMKGREKVKPGAGS